jgi:hypothetical protein
VRNVILVVPAKKKIPWCTYQTTIENLDKNVFYCSRKIIKGKMHECPYRSKEEFDQSEYKCLYYEERSDKK